MTIAGAYTPPQYTGNGATVSFAIPFPFFAFADIAVDLFDTNANAEVSPAPVLNGSGTYDYAISGGTQDPNTGEYSGYSVVFNNAPLANHRVTLLRATSETQQNVFSNNAPFPAKTVEATADRLTAIAQELKNTLGRALVGPQSDLASASATLPAASLRAGFLLGFDPSTAAPVGALTTASVAAAVAAYLTGTGVSTHGALDVSLAATLNAGLGLTDADAAAAAAGGALILDANVTLAANTTLNARMVIGNGGKITLGNFNISGNFWAPPFTQLFVLSGSGAVTLGKGVVASPVWFGADPTGTNDSTAAMNATAGAASSAYNSVLVPPGTYRMDGTLTLSAGMQWEASPGATLVRSTGAATTPVLAVLGISTSWRGGTIQSNNASPTGVVVLGASSASDNRNAWYWRFTDCHIGVAAGAGNIGVAVWSGQPTYGSNSANYFGTLERLTIFGGDIGLLFAELADAHNASNIFFWSQSTYCICLRGALENNLSNLFFHTGSANGLISIAIKNPTVGAVNPSFNQIVNFTSETAGSADRCLLIDTGASVNTVIGGDNNATPALINNASNFVMLNGNIHASIDISTGILGATSYGYFQTGTADPAGGGAQAISFGTSQTGIYWGTGVPSVNAPQGSLYLRRDGSSTSTRAYISLGGGSWTAITTAS